MRRMPTLLAVTFLFFASSVPAIAGAPSPTEEAEFTALIKSALEQKDRDAIAALSYWDGVDEEQRRFQEERQEGIFDRPIHKVELRPTPPGYRSEYVSNGLRYRINMPVKGLVRLEFAGALDVEGARLFPFGIHEGRYYIARVAKVGAIEAAEKEKQLFIGVMVPSGPEPADYIVSCSYDAGGEEVREKYEASGATQKVVWGRKINWCRLWNRSEDAWVRLVLKENLETYYESLQVEPGRTAVYP